MDLWVVAAAAGAGYLAKNLQNLPSSEKERLAESSSMFSTHISLESRNLLQQIRDKTCPLRRLGRRRALIDAFSEQKDGLDGRILDTEQLASTSINSHAGSRMPPTTRSGDVNVASDVVKEDYNVLWLSSLPPGFSGKESTLQHMEFVDADCSAFEVGNLKLPKTRPSRYYIKSLSSLQSGLVPQLYKEHEKVEDYVYSSLPSPCIPTMRPFLITEDTAILNRSNRTPLGIWSNSGEDTIKSDASRNEKNASSNDPSLDNTNLVELRGWTSGSTKRVFGKAPHSPGSPNLMLLFMIGISVGIISSIITNGNVTSLNEQLKKANNLVQDLQEELEMKDKLTMKALADENSQPPSTKSSNLFNQELIPSVPEPQANKPEASEIDNYGSIIANAKTGENSTLKNEIEVELETELERLELNMKTSVLDRTSGFKELDLEFEVDMTRNLLSKQYNCDSPRRDNDEESGTATAHTLPPNYAVSPRELTICLHELIESRLEAHIKELETALRNSQNRLQSLESACITYQGIPSAPESPAFVYEDNGKDGPLCSNVFRNTLDLQTRFMEK